MGLELVTEGLGGVDEGVETEELRLEAETVLKSEEAGGEDGVSVEGEEDDEEEEGGGGGGGEEEERMKCGVAKGVGRVAV